MYEHSSCDVNLFFPGERKSFKKRELVQLAFRTF